ncbi:MAG: MFS transporter, partial [Pseudomonadales bacterium]|nr:MFS transporter [Pseudomonadales bacterium]
MSDDSKSSSLYYGWKIVAVAFVVDFIAVGFFFYSYGVFFKALATEFGGSRLDVSIGITLVNVVSAILAPFLGRMLDVYPIKYIIVAGILAKSAGFVLLSLIGSQWQLYLVLATLIGVGTVAMGGLSTAKLVTNWFSKKRGTALGVATMGISLSGVAMPPISAWLIENYGWRTGFQVFAFITFVVVLPVVLRYVVSRPEHMGLNVDNIRTTDTVQPVVKHPHWSTRAALGHWNFWIVVLVFGLMFCSMGATLTHMVPRVTDLGFTLVEAAPILSFAAGAGVLGKVAYGWITDHWNVRYAVLTAIAAQVTGNVLLLIHGDYIWIATGGAIFGFGMGGIVPIHGSMVSELFGQQGFGFIMGLMRPAMMPLQVAGIPFAGWIFDITGSY